MVVSDDEIRESLETAQLALPARARIRPDDLLAARVVDGAPHRQRTHVAVLVRAPERTDPARVRSVPRQLRAGVPAAAVAGRRRSTVRCVSSDDASTRWASSAAMSTPIHRVATGPDRRCSTAYWWPLWEKMCELDVPAMIHVSAPRATPTSTPPARTTSAPTRPRSCRRSRRASWPTSPGCAGSSRTAAVRCRTTGVVSRAWPQDQGWDFDGLLDHICFDTCVYHQPGIDLLLERRADREHPVRLRDGRSRARHRSRHRRRHYDDTKIYVDSSSLDEDGRRRMFERNALGSSRDWNAVHASVPAGRCGHSLAGARSTRLSGRHHESPCRRAAASSAPSRPTVDGLGADRHGHGARGDRAARLSSVPSFGRSSRSVRIAGSAVTVLSHPGDNMMIHAAVEVCRAGRRARGRQHRPVDARHVRRPAGDVADGPRRTWPGDRCRRPRHLRSARDGVPGVDPARLVPGHGEGHARIGQRAGRRSAASSSSRVMSSAPTTTASSSVEPRRSRVGPRTVAGPARRRGRDPRPTRGRRARRRRLRAPRPKLAELGVEYVDGLEP